VTTFPRRTCPACSRRYGGLVDGTCPLCDGLGVLILGAAALTTQPAPVIARAVELYLEAHAHRYTSELPPGDARQQALEAARDDLRHTGVLSGPADVTRPPGHVDTPPDPASPTVAEHRAHTYTRTALRAPLQPRHLTALAAPPGDVVDVKPRTGLPVGSANGHRSALATIADPIDPLGPDAVTLDNARHIRDRYARVIVKAVERALTRHPRKAHA